MIGFVKFVVVSTISCKALEAMGKKEYSQMLQMVCWLWIGCMIVCKVGGWYDSFMDSRLVTLLNKLIG